MDPVAAQILHRGVVIPAHPLALTAERKLDERRQAALTRYYCEAGAGGIAVGVHTTQFAIREAGLYEPVLQCAIETARDWGRPGPAVSRSRGRSWQNWENGPWRLGRPLTARP